MPRRVFALASAIVGASFFALQACSDSPSEPSATEVSAFQDTAVAGPSDWNGPRFKPS